MTTKAPDLLPCPFCAAPAELERDSDHHGEWFNLGCSRHWGRVDPAETCPGARIWYTEETAKEADAIAAWNRRDLHAAVVTERDEFRRALEKIVDAAFYDNGDVTYDCGAMSTAYFAARAALAKIREGRE